MGRAGRPHHHLAHAGGHNGPSIGVEVVNPYYPTHLRDGLPWSRVIDAPWAHRDETGEIACTIWAQNGGDDLAALRTQVFGLLTDLADVIHTVNTLDPRLVDAHILRGDPIQRRTSGGVVCEVAFRVAYRAIFT